MNKKGFSLTELMIVAGIAGVISLFAMESVKSVIRSSVSVQKKADHNSLIEQIRGITNKLDQCTCNFRDLPIQQPNNITHVQPLTDPIQRFTQTQALVFGGATCVNPVAPAFAPGQFIYQTEITAIELQDKQFLQPLSVLRANLFIEGQIRENNQDKIIRRKIPVMFSTQVGGAGGVEIRGCIGMTE